MAPHAQTGTRPVQQTVERPVQHPEEPTIGALVHDLSEEIPALVRSEIRLAQAEMAQKGRTVGLGVGLFGAAGLLALLGVGALVATAILALALALPGWLSALVVTAVLFALAGLVALVGRTKVGAGQPLEPERAVAGIRQDIATVKGATR